MVTLASLAAATIQREQGRSPLATGLAFAPMTGIVLAANLGAGRLAQWCGTRRVIVASGVIAAASFAALLEIGQSTSTWRWSFS